MSARSEPTARSLILPASLAAAALVAVTAMLWASHGEAVFLETLVSGFVGCLG